MTSSPVTPLAVRTSRQLESNSIHIGFPSSSSRHKGPTITLKLLVCTFRVIPLCVAILVIFSIGGGLAYAINKEPLPKEAVVGVSIAFLILGVFFALGCLKMYHSTHESHIPRLNTARNAYERFFPCPRKLHNRLSKFLEPKQKDDYGADHREFLHRRSAESQEIRNSGASELGFYGQRNKPSPQTQSGIWYDRVQAQRENIAQEERYQGHQELRQWYGVDGYLEQNYPARHTFGTYRPLILPDTEASNCGLPHATTVRSKTSSIGHTPSHMVAGRAKPNFSESPRKPIKYNPKRYGHYYGNQNRESLQVNRDSRQTSGAAVTPDQLYVQCRGLQTNLAVTPEDLGQDVFRNLYQTTNVHNLVYQITNLVGMPETQRDLKDDGLPILPRSSSKIQTTTAPFHSVNIQKPALTVMRASSQTAERANKESPVTLGQVQPCVSGPVSDRDDNSQLDPELAGVKPLTGNIAPTRHDNDGGGSGQSSELFTGENVLDYRHTERTYGRSLTKRKF